jgi:hypothetical protein
MSEYKRLNPEEHAAVMAHLREWLDEVTAHWPVETPEQIAERKAERERLECEKLKNNLSQEQLEEKLRQDSEKRWAELSQKIKGNTK